MFKKVLLLCVLCFVALWLLSCSTAKKDPESYEKGVQAYEDGNFVIAKGYFISAGDYEDSTMYIDIIDQILSEGFTSEADASEVIESIEGTPQTAYEERTETIATTTVAALSNRQIREKLMSETESSEAEEPTKDVSEAQETLETSATVATSTARPTPRSTTTTMTAVPTTEQQRTLQYTNAIYNGDIDNGEPNGYGEMIWTDGASYTGYWKDGLLHGSGTMIFSNGDKYVGEWLNNEQNGIGTYTWANGKTYSGLWENGEMVPTPTTTQTETKTTTQASTTETTTQTTTIPATDSLHIIAEDGTYLGELNTNKFDSNSIFNKYGTYGNEYSSKSIWNKYGHYGSKYSLQSPFNDYTTTPPYIVSSNQIIIGRLTTNEYVNGSISPNVIYAYLLENGY